MTGSVRAIAVDPDELRRFEVRHPLRSGRSEAWWRIAVLVCLSFLSFGLLGFWQDSLDTLIVTGI